MSDGIISLTTRRPDVDLDIVEMAERLGRWAREGKIIGLAYCTVMPNGSLGTAFKSADGRKRGNELLAAAALLQHRIVCQVDASDDVPGPDEA